MNYKATYLAKTFFGLEDILVEELQNLGARKVTPGKRAVSFEGDKTLLYKANLHLRTALRILVPVHQFTAKNEHQLYKNVQSLNWSKFINKRDTFAIDSTVHSGYFKHSKYIALKTKDAIVDQFRKHYNMRPSIDVINPTVRLHLHIREDMCSISLDSSGDSLHKRGYRTATNRAPINEVLAAGMIMLSGWRGDAPFLDLMCGSGTIPCEAALLAQNVAPGTFREKFGFFSWKDYDKKLWQEVKEEAKTLEVPLECPIMATDVSQKTIEIARGNLAHPAFEDIRMSRKDFFEYTPKYETGLLLINPPYGERFVQQNITDFYGNIGDKLKQNYNGYTAWIISSNKTAMKSIGLRPSKRLTLYNGSLECKFHRFDLYSGSKKNKK